ncbi:MAG: hypothetical protein ABSA70_13580 [Terriglobia bacterium]
MDNAGALIVMLSCSLAVWGVGVAESVAVTVKFEVAAAVGVPEIDPELLSVRLAGKLPLVTLQV